MAYEGSYEVDWAKSYVKSELPNGPYYRYNPRSSDNDVMIDRNIGDKEFKHNLRNFRVQFSVSEKVDALPSADWYLYETLRIMGEGAIR